MTADLKSLEEIEIRLAELDGRCAHEWEAKFAPMNMAGGKKVYWYCYKCETPDNNPNREPPAVDNPVCQSLETLIDYAVEKRFVVLNRLTGNGMFSHAQCECIVSETYSEDYKRRGTSVFLKDYPSPSAAELHARANAVLQAREAQNNGKDKS